MLLRCIKILYRMHYAQLDQPFLPTFFAQPSQRDRVPLTSRRTDPGDNCSENLAKSPSFVRAWCCCTLQRNTMVAGVLE